MGSTRKGKLTRASIEPMQSPSGRTWPTICTAWAARRRVTICSSNSTGAPGMQWAERRGGVVRPRLEWKIQEMK